MGKRELATLKVLGFYNNEVTMYVYRENIVLTMLGAVFGVLLGWILHRFIIVTVEIESVMFGRNIDLSSFVFAFLLTVLFSCIVNGAMYFKIKKIDKHRSDYYRYYTGHDWNDVRNYSFCINSGRIGFQKTAQAIRQFAELKLGRNL